MKRWLMEILVCPRSDCRSILSLDVYDAHIVEAEGKTVEEIDEALITCPKCGRWYPVIEGIPCMLPDDLRADGRQRKEERAFLERWKEHIPVGILKNGVPFGLTSET